MTRSSATLPAGMRHVAALAGLTGALFFAPLARAQSAEDAATARALFKEARTLSAAGKYGEACPKFEESLRLNRGLGTEFNLADCWEHLGRTASAWARFLEVAASARATNQGEREQVARERAASLEGKLPRLVIRASERPTGMEIKRDGDVVGASVLGVAVPADPGAHRIDVTAPGKRPYGVTVALSSGKTTTVDIPALEDAPAAQASSPAEASTPAPTESSPSDAPADRGSTWSGQKTLALTLAGVGVAGAAVGTFFFTQYSSANKEAKGICATANDPCPKGSATRHDELTSTAKTDGTLAYVGWGVGAAGLVGAAVLWFTAPKQTEQASQWRFTAGPALTGAGATASMATTW